MVDIYKRYEPSVDRLKKDAGLERLKAAAENVAKTGMNKDVIDARGNYVINSIFQHNGKNGTSIEDYMKAVSNEKMFSKDFQNQFELLVNMLDRDGDGIVSNEEELILKGNDNNVSMEEIGNFINAWGFNDENKINDFVSDITSVLDSKKSEEKPDYGKMVSGDNYGCVYERNDENGNLIQTHVDHNGKLAYVSTTSFDADGNKSKVETAYGENGDKLESAQYKDGKMTSSTVTENGLITEETLYDKDGKTAEKTNYQYNDKGEKIYSLNKKNGEDGTLTETATNYSTSSTYGTKPTKSTITTTKPNGAKFETNQNYNSYGAVTNKETKTLQYAELTDEAYNDIYEKITDSSWDTEDILQAIDKGDYNIKDVIAKFDTQAMEEYAKNAHYTGATPDTFLKQIGQKGGMSADSPEAKDLYNKIIDSFGGINSSELSEWIDSQGYYGNGEEATEPLRKGILNYAQEQLTKENYSSDAAQSFNNFYETMSKQEKRGVAAAYGNSFREMSKASNDFKEKWDLYEKYSKNPEINRVMSEISSTRDRYFDMPDGSKISAGEIFDNLEQITKFQTQEDWTKFSKYVDFAQNYFNYLYK